MVRLRPLVNPVSRWSFRTLRAFPATVNQRRRSRDWHGDSGRVPGPVNALYASFDARLFGGAELYEGVVVGASLRAALTPG